MPTALELVTERVNRNGDIEDRATPIPLLTLEEFFSGNNVAGSICCNVDPMPRPSEVFSALLAIRARPDVSDVRIAITMFDDPEWPFSDTAWVLTNATEDEVCSWFPREFRPDECGTGWTPGSSFEPCPMPDGTVAISCWWD